MAEGDISKRLAGLSPERRAALLKLLGRGADDARPAVVLAAPEARFEPFPLTDLQQAYWIGRSGGFELGDVSIHSYIEIDIEGIGAERLEAAIRCLVARHDMLRAIVHPDGKQAVLADVPPYDLRVQDLRGLGDDAAAARIGAWRDEMSHEVLPADRWPLFSMRASIRRDDLIRLHASLDGLVFDGWSIHLFFAELAELIANPAAAPKTAGATFRDCVVFERAQKSSEAYGAARDYWRARLDDFPGPPLLPFETPPSQVAKTRFVRETRRLDRDRWSRLEKTCAASGLTTTGLLLAVYAEVLGLYAEKPRFIINVPRFNRAPIHPDVDKIIGEFASFTLLEVDLTQGGSFLERARRLQERLWRDLDNVAFTGVEVLRDLALARADGRPILMPVVFTASARDAEGRDAYATSTAKRLGKVAYAINQTSQVWLDNHVHVEDGELVCDWDYVSALFPKAMQDAMLAAYFVLLERLADEPTSWNESRRKTAWSLLPEDQKERRRAVNGTSFAIPETTLVGLLHDAFERFPERIAIVSSQKRWTYRELGRRVARLAARLRALGAERGGLVAVGIEKSPEQILAALAVQATGAAYLPLDVESPPERTRYLLENGRVRLVVTDTRSASDVVWPDFVRLVPVDADDDVVAAEFLAPAIAPDDLAVVIYTSGSTGKPKGVMVTHRNIVSTVVYTNAVWKVTERDCAIQLTALHHDLAEYDIFGMLAAGGTIAIPDARLRRDPAHWAELMDREAVTIWNTVPAMMEMMLEYADSAAGAFPTTLRLVILGGDWVPITLPERLRRHAPQAELLSIGGPTETTIWNVWYPVGAVDPTWRSIPYGKPTANNAYHVLTEEGLDAPDFVPGEMVSTGLGVTLGYWGDPERTAEKYVFLERTGDRGYRTGDRGRYRPDGNLEFLGRADLQVKIQGQRIELGEIEAAIRSLPGVRMAAVRVFDDARGKKWLAGYALPDPGAVVEEAALRAHCVSRLPQHMVPLTLTVLERFPLTANGKIDRTALPRPGSRGVDGDSAPSARAVDDSHLERIRGIVADALGVQVADVDADLMTLGANSLDMVRIGNRLEKEFKRRPRIDELFRMRRVRALAEFYGGDAAPASEAPARAAGSGFFDELIARFPVILDPEEKEAFKKREPGIRRDDGARPYVRLDAPGAAAADLDERWLARRSARRFLAETLPFARFSDFLAVLLRRKLGGNPKYLYPSAGALYPVQVYVHAKPGRIEGLPGGLYYFRPDTGRLVLLAERTGIDATVHVPFINSPVFEAAAFSLFFVARLAAIAPLYGEHAARFAILEAGAMTQLLDLQCAGTSLGFCSIGSVEWDRIKASFELDPTDVLVHSLVGGLRDPNEDHPFRGKTPDVEEGEL